MIQYSSISFLLNIGFKILPDKDRSLDVQTEIFADLELVVDEVVVLALKARAFIEDQQALLAHFERSSQGTRTRFVL